MSSILKIKTVCFSESSFGRTRTDGVMYRKTTI